MNAYLDGRPEPAARRLSRFLVFGVVVVLAITTLTARLFYLQIVNGGEFKALSTAQAHGRRVDPVAARPDLRPQGPTARLERPDVRGQAPPVGPAGPVPARRSSIGSRSMIGMDPAEINAIIDSNPGSSFDLVRIAGDVDEATARLISESSTQLPGVEIVVEARREYADGPLMSQILGYTGPGLGRAAPGPASPRATCPTTSSARPGSSSSTSRTCAASTGPRASSATPAARRRRSSRPLTDVRPGDSLRLTIDTKIQKEAEKALKWGIRAIGNKRGVLIAMNPQTGEVLALVSLPTYDNNAVRARDQQQGLPASWSRTRTCRC